MTRFETLDIWKDSIALAKDVFISCQRLPNELKYSVGDQLRRSILSVPSNIAEGSGAESKKDEKRYLDIAIKSAYESLSHLFFVREMTGREVKIYVDKLTILIRRIRAFKNTI